VTGPGGWKNAPDILNINIVQCLGQQRTRPSGIALRRRRPWTVVKSAKPVIGKAPVYGPVSTVVWEGEAARPTPIPIHWLNISSAFVRFAVGQSC
jgi:hypothetical protein